VIWDCNRESAATLRCYTRRMRVVLTVLVLSASLAAQTATPAPPAPSTTAHHPPQAKTQPEYKDYTAAYVLNGGAALEKAANNFAAKYPDSELRVFLYSKAMHNYQNENNPAKMLAMGEKVLALDPDNSIALVLTATVLADNLRDDDADRETRIAEIKRNADRALSTVDANLVAPANATPEQIAAYKSTLQSMAHSALGIMELKTAADAAAERHLRLAADLNKTQPDPYIWYHLALAQDHQSKYADALASVNQALKYTAANADLSKLAQAERDRLVKLTASSKP
jgi:tetratricopeptide (TPR) repeat protein